MNGSKFMRRIMSFDIHFSGTPMLGKRLLRSCKSHWNRDETMESHDSRSTGLRKQRRRTDESEATTAVIFAGIAALFVAGIAAAFIYAKDTTFIQTADAPAPSMASSGSGAQPAETTGSGAINRIPPKQDPREDEQRESP